MVEATFEDDQDYGTGHTSRRFPYDRALLMALVDRWRPETHTFHLSCGEMAPMLQDMSFLLRLPCAGFLLAAYDISTTWRTDLLEKFHDVLPPGSNYTEFSSPHGPTLKWICQFYPERMAPSAGDVVVRRHFEAYLLWLFEWVIFLGSHGDSVDKHYVWYAHEVANLPIGEILLACHRGTMVGAPLGRSTRSHRGTPSCHQVLSSTITQGRGTRSHRGTPSCHQVLSSTIARGRGTRSRRSMSPGQ